MLNQAKKTYSDMNQVLASQRIQKMFKHSNRKALLKALKLKIKANYSLTHMTISARSATYQMNQYSNSVSRTLQKVKLIGIYNEKTWPIASSRFFKKSLSFQFLLIHLIIRVAITSLPKTGRPSSHNTSTFLVIRKLTKCIR